LPARFPARTRRDRLKFRGGQIVYAAFSQDEPIMGFGFPREERDAPSHQSPKRVAQGHLDEQEVKDT
jgi:hypothetical protein